MPPTNADADDLLAAGITSVLVIDWPTRDVPDTLARAGWTVVVKGGPGPDDCSAYEVANGPSGDEVVVRPLGRRPEHADLVYCHRPLAELPGIVAQARQIGARAVWLQSGRSETGAKDPTGCWMPDAEATQARTIVESAGLVYIDAPYIADAVRRAQAKSQAQTPRPPQPGSS